MVLDDETLRRQFAHRLNEAMSQHPDTANPRGRAAFLARKLEVTPKAASKWVNGEAIPRGARLLELCKILGVSVGWLRDGESEQVYKNHPGSTIPQADQVSEQNSPYIIEPRTRLLPILNSTQAISPAISIAADDVEGFLGVPLDMTLGTDAFYFRIDDDSMVSSTNQMFSRGTMVAIDPAGKLEPGVFVLAKVTEKGKETVVFRAYFENDIVDGFETFELVPLNKAVRTIKVTSADKGAIIGTLAGFYTPATAIRYNSL